LRHDPGGLGFSIYQKNAGYRLHCGEIVRAIPLEERGFGFASEVAVKIDKQRLRVTNREYAAAKEERRFVEETHVRCLWCLLKYSIKERAVTVAYSVDSEQAALATRQELCKRP
jgi:hypothetical protein